jgi:hypothetical protein
MFPAEIDKIYRGRSFFTPEDAIGYGWVGKKNWPRMAFSGTKCHNLKKDRLTIY